MSDLNSFMRETAIPELFDRLDGDAERLKGDIQRLQRFVEQTQTVITVSAPGVEVLRREQQPAASEPVEMEASARQRLEADAHAAATQMVERVNLMREQKQSTATSLAYALRAAREASAGFQCPRTMEAILRALDGMDAAAREEQSNG